MDDNEFAAYVAAYKPKSLSVADWRVVRVDAAAAVYAVGPVSRCDAKNLLGSLARYLARMCPAGEVRVGALTRDGVERFIVLERMTSAHDITIGQVSRHLRRILRAADGTVVRAQRRPPAASLAFDPVDGVEWAALKRAASSSSPDRVEGLAGFLDAGEGCGFEVGALAQAGWGTERIARLRADLRAQVGMGLELSRLRHRWLLHVLQPGIPVATVADSHGLTRRDLDRVVQAFIPTVEGSAALRAA